MAKNPKEKDSEVPGYAIDDGVRRILKVRQLLAKKIPEKMRHIQLLSTELQQMASLADKIDTEVPRVALNEIEGQKG